MATYLWRYRTRINPPHAASEREALAIRANDATLQPLRFLFSAYRPRFWYFDCIDMLRRIIM